MPTKAEMMEAMLRASAIAQQNAGPGARVVVTRAFDARGTLLEDNVELRAEVARIHETYSRPRVNFVFAKVETVYGNTPHVDDFLDSARYQSTHRPSRAKDGEYMRGMYGTVKEQISDLERIRASMFEFGTTSTTPRRPFWDEAPRPFQRRPRVIVDGECETVAVRTPYEAFVRRATLATKPTPPSAKPWPAAQSWAPYAARTDAHQQGAHQPTREALRARYAASKASAKAAKRARKRQR